MPKSLVKLLKKLNRIFRLKAGQVEVYLVDDSFMSQNVLAFPAPKNFPRPDLPGKIKPLGEIYLNPKQIRREGGQLTSMLIHGFLHLLGYDHKKKSDRIEMEKKEKQLWRQIKSSP